MTKNTSHRQHRLSSFLDRFQPSATIALATKAAQMRAEGIDVIPLGGGDPDFPTPENVREAAKHKIDSGDIGYTGVHGTAEMKNAVVTKFARDNALEFKPDQIAVSDGSKQVVLNALYAIVEPGDEVLVPSPYWVCYPELIRLVGGKPAIVETSVENGFKLTPAQLSKSITDRTKAIIVNSPNNPTGATYSADEVRQLVEVLADWPRIWIIADDLYEQIRFDGRPYATFAHFEAIRDRVITVSGVSKTYAMTGWRIGFAGGPADLIAGMAKVQSQSISCPSAVTQAAAVAALQGPQDGISSRLEAYDHRRKLLVDAFNRIDGFCCLQPEGAFYIFPNCAGLIGRSWNFPLNTDMDVARFLLEEARVTAVPGSEFGCSPYLRLSFAFSTAEIETAISRVASACKKLRPN